MRKRAVNLTLTQDVVNDARRYTDNLSGVVDSLLSEYVERERQARIARERSLADTVALWNAFSTRGTSFADEYSPL